MNSDSFGRKVDYLRISITDRCNLRCVYCMPSNGVPSKPHDSIMRFEEIERFVIIAAKEGIRHIRITGGEPLARLGVVDLVEHLAHTDGIESVALTTNGILLPNKAQALKAAGLSRVNISLDTLDSRQYAKITRCGRLEDAIAGIDAALEVEFDPVKVNVVVVRSLNQDFLEFVKLTLNQPLHIRFIEYMPIGECSGIDGYEWTHEDVISSDELKTSISELANRAGYGPLQKLDGKGTPIGWGPASYYRLLNAQGTIGFISPLTHSFCNLCNRMRLTADGKLRPCLFSDEEFDILHLLRSGSDEEIRDAFRTAVRAKPKSHHDRVGTTRGMSQIGG